MWEMYEAIPRRKLKSLGSSFLDFLVNLPTLRRYFFYGVSFEDWQLAFRYNLLNCWWLLNVTDCYLICIYLFYFQPIRSPLAPSVLITGIVPSESSIFKSALHPLRLTFRTENGGSCKIIFKKGDDLRQDQLVSALKMICIY